MAGLLKRFDTATDDAASIRAGIARPYSADVALQEAAVGEILANVQARGDAALLEYTRQWDSPHVENIEVPAAEWEAGAALLNADQRSVIETAAARITAFHEAQKRRSWWMTTLDGGLAGQWVQPLQRVGIYVPGGKAVYPSSVLMNALPAHVAGVPEVVLCVPPLADGSVHPAVLFAARLAGVSRLFRVGGAQAVAAMAFGTETVPAVDKIAGPGNLYVTLAKRQVSGQVGIDMPAGPSEVCIVVNSTSRPAFAAADLLVQVEHAEDCTGYLIAVGAEVADAVEAELEKQLAGLPREAILRAALAHSATIVVSDLDEALRWANEVAPEHLSLMVDDALALLGRVRNAGAVLLGHFTPQSLGDYAAGPSHTLPTNGAARFASPLSVDDFVKKTSVIAYDRASLASISATVQGFAEMEGFQAHARAAAIREEDLHE